MVRALTLSVTLAALLTAACGDRPRAAKQAANPAGLSNRALVVHDYANLVHRAYTDAYVAARNLQKAVDAFLDDPSARNLIDARIAWLHARDPYSRTEAFRYYEGPIDAEDGPEGRMNAWPLNEAYIDYVEGNPPGSNNPGSKAGIISDTTFDLTEKSIADRNAKDDEADVTTGYHAIEFLLWGQDRSLDSAGMRPADDYKSLPGGDPIRERRRTYLKLVTDLLVKDLKSLVDAWDPRQENNFRVAFTTGSPADTDAALGKILTGLASLCGFELASERLAAALDSGSQEDEQSCFSDNTHSDLIHNCRGIANVYLGKLDGWHGRGLNTLVDAIDPALNKKIEDRLRTTQTLVSALDTPIDRTLASPKGSASRKKMEDLVKSLQIQAELFKEAGKALGVEVVVKAE